jgi:hypothetical protein
MMLIGIMSTRFLCINTLEQYFQQIPTTSVVDKGREPAQNGTTRALMVQNSPQIPPQENFELAGWT